MSDLNLLKEVKFDKIKIIKNKLIKDGVDFLDDFELLSLILENSCKKEDCLELSKSILSNCDSILKNLCDKKLEEFKQINKMNIKKSILLICCIEFGKRIFFKKNEKNKTYKDSKSVFILMKDEFIKKLHEEFWIVLLNNSFRLIKKICVSSGGLSSTVVDPRIIFKFCIENSSTKIVLIHNHPSGNLIPSKEDIKITQKIIEGSKLLDINVIDHIILGEDDNYFSFADNNILFNLKF
jgi:DNA repair protein RadC